MAVGLMPYIPYDTVFRGIIYIMQCHGNLGYAEARCQMAGIHGYLLDDVLSQFLTDFW
jgi:hypothetical protein